MKSRHALAKLATTGIVAMAAAAGSPALGGKYPERPVMIVTPSGAGAGPDVITRIIADRFSRAWGRQVVVVNRPGGGGAIAAQVVSAAERDGYTLYLPISSTFVVLPETQTKLPLDLQHDIVPIGLIGEQPMVLTVNPSLGVNTLQELIAVAKKRPGHFLYGAGRGSMPHLAGALFAQRSGIEVGFVPYPTAARALTDTIGGTLSFFVESAASVSGPVHGGQLRALAVASAKRLPDLPDVPTVAEAVPELHGFEARGWFALMALAGTPDGAVQHVRQTLQVVLAQPEVAEKLATLGTYPRPMSPAETADFIRAEQELWRPLVRQIGMSPQ